MPNSISVRILRDPKANDGWIAKDNRGKICFIENIDLIISKLEAGQQWQALEKLVRPRHKIVQLDYLLKA